MKKPNHQKTFELVTQCGYVTSLMVQRHCPTIYPMTPIKNLVDKGLIIKTDEKIGRLYKYKLVPKELVLFI